MIRLRFVKAALLALSAILDFSARVAGAPADSATKTPSHFLAANGMACYEASNETALKETLLLYRDTPWSEFYEASEVVSGSCVDASYIISTTNPEECAQTNTSLAVFLDLDAGHNIDWAQAERLAVLKAAEGDLPQAALVLASTADKTCTKPQLMHFSERAEKVANEQHSVEWTVGKTAVIQSKGSRDKQAEADAAVAEAMQAKEQADELAQRAADAKVRAEEAEAKAKTKQAEAEKARAEKRKAERTPVKAFAKVAIGLKAGQPVVNDKVEMIEKALKDLTREVQSLKAVHTGSPSFLQAGASDVASPDADARSEAPPAGSSAAPEERPRRALRLAAPLEAAG